MATNMDTPSKTLQESASNQQNTRSRMLRLHVCPIAGSQFEVELLDTESVDSLKRLVATKIKVQKERINLLINQR